MIGTDWLLVFVVVGLSVGIGSYCIVVLTRRLPGEADRQVIPPPEPYDLDEIGPAPAAPPAPAAAGRPSWLDRLRAWCARPQLTGLDRTELAQLTVYRPEDWEVPRRG